MDKEQEISKAKRKTAKRKTKRKSKKINSD